MKPTRRHLSDVLEREYGIIPVSIDDAPRGFVAETYVAAASDGRRYFAKRYPHWSDAGAAVRGVPALLALHEQGIDTISRPVCLRDGRPASSLDGRMLILFDFVEGRAGNAVLAPSLAVDYDLEAFVRLLSRIHTAKLPSLPDVPIEDFSLPFADRFEQSFRSALACAEPTPARTELQHLLHRHQEQITADWSTLASLAHACRATTRARVITHGDALGDNIIVAPDGRLYLIDWDGLMLAPPERDTWFFLTDEAMASPFLEIYSKTNPAYRPDPLLLRFYLYRRFFEDLTGYLIPIFESSSTSHQEWILSELQITCFQWLWPAIRRHSATAR